MKDKFDILTIAISSDMLNLPYLEYVHESKRKFTSGIRKSGLNVERRASRCMAVFARLARSKSDRILRL